MPTSTRPGTRLGRYHLGARIGEGGMAEVFRGQIEGAAGFSKPVAIKRVRASLAQDPAIRDAFVQEARVARRMEHGNIVQIYDLGSEDGVPYLVIELVDGLSLAELLAALRSAGTRLPVAEALHVIESVAVALHHAHQLTDERGRPAGVVHRDVTPRNILVSRDGVVKLADFGIAKARHLPSETLPGIIKGTLGYLSPEQASGAPVDARSDQFSAGLVLYEMLAGDNPLARTDSIQEYARMLSEGIPALPCAPAGSAPAPVDGALAAIVSRAVAVRPAERFPSMADVHAALEAWRVARGIRTAPDALRARIRAILGEASTGVLGGVSGAAPRALDQALDAQLAARVPRHTRARQPAAPAGRDIGRGLRRPRLVAALVAGMLGMAGAAWLAWPAAAPPGPPASAAPQPASAAAIQATVPQPNPAEPAAAAAPPAAAPPAAAARPGPLAAPAEPGSEQPALPAAAPAPALDPAPPAARDGRAPARARDLRPGRIKINLIPYAQVRVNGKLLGTTPVDEPLPAGTHTLVLDNPDTGQRATRTIRVAPGETLDIQSW